MLGTLFAPLLLLACAGAAQGERATLDPWPCPALDTLSPRVSHIELRETDGADAVYWVSAGAASCAADPTAAQAAFVEEGFDPATDAIEATPGLWFTWHHPVTDVRVFDCAAVTWWWADAWSLGADPPPTERGTTPGGLPVVMTLADTEVGDTLLLAVEQGFEGDVFRQAGHADEELTVDLVSWFREVGATRSYGFCHVSWEFNVGEPFLDLWEVDPATGAIGFSRAWPPLEPAL